MKSLYLIIGEYTYRLKDQDLFENDGHNSNCLIKFINVEKNSELFKTPYWEKVILVIGIIVGFQLYFLFGIIIKIKKKQFLNKIFI